MEDDAEVLEDMRPHRILGLASQDRINFGKFEQDFGGRRVPRAPTGFNYYGNERETIFHAKALGGAMVAFEILVLHDCRARVIYGRRDAA